MGNWSRILGISLYCSYNYHVNLEAPGGRRTCHAGDPTTGCRFDPWIGKISREEGLATTPVIACLESTMDRRLGELQSTG